MLALCDDACDTLFDHECRTACRRLLARLAQRSPQFFRRRTVWTPASAAASVCWIVGKANQLFETTAPPRIKDLGDVLGVTTPGARARTIMPLAGCDEPGYNRVVVASRDLLVSAHRRRILELRDQYSAPASSTRRSP